MDSSILHSCYSSLYSTVKNLFSFQSLTYDELIQLLLASAACNIFLWLIAKRAVKAGWLLQGIYTLMLCAVAASVLVFLSSAPDPFMLADMNKLSLGTVIAAFLALYFYILAYYINMCALSGSAYKTLQFGLYDAFGYAKWISFSCYFSPVSGLIIGGLSLCSYEYMLYACVAYIVIYLLITIMSFKFVEHTIAAILFVPIHFFIQIICVILFASFIHVYLLGLILFAIFAFLGCGSSSSYSQSSGRRRVGVTEDNEGNIVDVYEENGSYHSQYRGGGSRMGY